MTGALLSGGVTPGAAADDVLACSLADALDTARVGGKAANLARVIGLGLSVPDGFVLTTAALESVIDANALTEVAADAVRTVQVTSPESRGSVADAKARSVEEAFLDARIPGVLREEIARLAAPMLSAGAVVVRSSAVGEDSATESYAGQLDSFLHITSTAALERAILRCWASCWSARVLAYRAGRGLAMQRMGVIVQRQVSACAAGVMFTRASDDSVVVEYVAGLADGLVAGHADPGRFALGRRDAAVRILAPTPAEAAAVEARMLSAPVTRQLLQAATRLEEALGTPQDVEWTLDRGGALIIVQSRPITAPLVLAPAPATAPSIRWSNANINENYPDPVSPLLYSIATAGYRNYFRGLAVAFGFSRSRIGAMDHALGAIVGAHGGRLYYNLTSIHTVLRSAPLGPALVRAFNDFVGAAEESGAPAVSSGSRGEEWVELARIALTTAWRYRNLGARVDAFERLVGDFARRTHPTRLPALSSRELRLAFAEFMEIRQHRWTNAALADAAAMVCYAVLRRLVRDSGAGDAVHNTLLTAIPNLVSGAPVHRLWELSRLVRADARLQRLLEEDAATVLEALRTDPSFAGFRTRLDEYLEDWGFRCSSELMLVQPDFQEHPAPLLDTIRAYARCENGGPAEALARQAAERDAEIARTAALLRRRSGIPFRRLTAGPALRLALRCTQTAIACRERARLMQALLYSRCRRIALALGERLVEAGHLAHRDDVFWLRADELMALADGSEMLPGSVRTIVSERRREHADVTRVVPPDSFELPEGAFFAGAAGDASGSAPVDGALRGTGACGGRYTGAAAVLTDVTESGCLTGGEVLVTRQTDPGWAPAFFLIRGLVIERGGMLSHGAIVAREFGIPCVVGVRHATSRIAHGSMLAVDGDRGVVDVIA